MSIYLKGVILALLAVFNGHLAYSQSEMSLEECIKTAQDRNIGIERQGLQVALAKDNLQTLQAARLPGIEGFMAHNLSSGKTVNYDNYTYINTRYQDGNIGIQGSLPVFSGFGSWYLIKASRFALLSESGKKDELKKAIALDVTAAYLQVLFAGELLAIAETKLESTKEQLRMNEGFFDAGRLSKVEVLSIKSQVAQDNLSKIQAESDVKTAYLTLAQLLNMDNEGDLRIKKPANPEAGITLEIDDPETVYQYARMNHPAMASAEFLVKSRESTLSAMRSRLSPTLAVNGILYSRYSELGVNPLSPSAPYAYSSQLKDNLYGRAAINISIPIFTQFQTRNRINQANILAMDARLSMDQKAQAIKHDIQLAFAAAMNARAKYEATSEAITSASESFKLIQEKYKSGLSSSVDFKVAQNQLMEARSIRAQSKYELIIRSKILDLFLDKPISLE